MNWDEGTGTPFELTEALTEPGQEQIRFCCSQKADDYYAPPLIGGGIKRCFCLTSVWSVHRA